MPIKKSKSSRKKHRSKLPKELSAKQIHNKLWPLCKQLIRQRYGNTCYTCDAKNLKSSNWHTGHMLPRGSCGAYLKYDLRNLRPQCYNCNINWGGNGAVFITRMREIEGDNYVNSLFSDKNLVIKAKPHWLSLIDEYTKMLEESK